MGLTFISNLCLSLSKDINVGSKRDLQRMHVRVFFYPYYRVCIQLIKTIL